jgi:hypothetical protein
MRPVLALKLDLNSKVERSDSFHGSSRQSTTALRDPSPPRAKSLPPKKNNKYRFRVKAFAKPSVGKQADTAAKSGTRNVLASRSAPITNLRDLSNARCVMLTSRADQYRSIYKDRLVPMKFEAPADSAGLR